MLTGLTVCSHAGETFLSKPKKGSTIEECDRMFLNGRLRGGGQSELERGREGGKDGPFNQHTHALACLYYGYGCEPRLRERH